MKTQTNVWKRRLQRLRKAGIATAVLAVVAVEFWLGHRLLQDFWHAPLPPGWPQVAGLW